MVWFLLGIILVLALVGGAFYGFSYLTAKAGKISVTDALLKNAADLAKKPEAPK